jgi:hypothetical protein
MQDEQSEEFSEGRMENGKETDRAILLGIRKKVEDMHPIITVELPRMQVILERITTAQNTMSSAADRMAATHEHAEKRFSKLEDRLQIANDKASGKGQIPLVSHYLILGSMVGIAVLVVLYVNQQTIDATLTSISIGQEQVQKNIMSEIHGNK